MRKTGLENRIRTGQTEGKRKITQNILIELEQMDSRTGFRGNKRNTKFIKSFKAQEIVENPDRLRSEVTRYIK